MIKPTVGRVVWYRPLPSDPPGEDFSRDEKMRYAAIVAHATDDTCVNLMVIDQKGGTFNRTSVILVHEGNPEPGQCEWMPYQKGQAARDEEYAERTRQNTSVE